MINSVGVVAKKHKDFGQLADGYLKKTPIFQFIIVSLMFPLWGTAASLNDILITQFKTVFALNDAATAFVQSAFYGGYFLVAIPASFVIRKASYKVTIMTGLVAYILGAGLFFPASRVATYSMFLVAIFAIAIGLSFLETASDTYSVMMGPKKYANLRLNISRMIAVHAAVGASFFFGPQWPTIYAHTLDHVTDKRYTETAGAILVMAIVGGAVIPAVQGLVSDAVGSMQLSFLVPTIAFALVSYYFATEVKQDMATGR